MVRAIDKEAAPFALWRCRLPRHTGAGGMVDTSTTCILRTTAKHEEIMGRESDDFGTVMRPR